jgi:hypothetical protein
VVVKLLELVEEAAGAAGGGSKWDQPWGGTAQRAAAEVVGGKGKFAS